MKYILFFVLPILTLQALAQDGIAHFSVWQPKPGMENQFETGYKQHLQWHVANKDSWSWYGWYVISGARAGYFIDATFNHQWADFDKPVNPAGDAADNGLHTEPFGDFRLAFKVKFLPLLSQYAVNSLQSKFLRFITIQVTNKEQALAAIGKVVAQYRSKGANSLMVYDMVDGGTIPQIILLIGSESFAAMGITENITDDLLKAASSLKATPFGPINSELWRYRADMSMFPQ